MSATIGQTRMSVEQQRPPAAFNRVAFGFVHNLH
jgi:hypothetical protein